MCKRTLIRLIGVCCCVSFTLSLAFGQAGVTKGISRYERGVDWQYPLVGKQTETEYYLGIGDIIEILVWKNPDLSKTYKINPDGTIYMPLVGRVMAINLTIEQLRNKIMQKLSPFIRYPDVTIAIEAVAGYKFIILGEISYPGIYTYEGQINLIEAIGLAGDFTEDAKRESVIVVSNNLTENPEVRRVNLFRAIRKGTSNPEIFLSPNDIVYVPRTFIADFTDALDTLQSWMSDAEDIITPDIWDWKREIRWLYKRNIKSKTRK